VTQPRMASAICASAFLTLTTVVAQQPPPAAPVVRTARQLASADLTGYWVAQVNEDWRWRMMTPPKGDYEGVPLSAAGRKAADGWDLARDAANGALCRAYGAGGVMRLPLRLHVTWADDETLKIETDAGRQTRLFAFKPDERPGPRSLQGHSVAQWMHLPPVPAGEMGGWTAMFDCPTGSSFARHVRAMRGRSAERSHQREVVCASDQRAVSVDLAAHERCVCFHGSPDQFGGRLAGDGSRLGESRAARRLDELQRCQAGVRRAKH